MDAHQIVLRVGLGFPAAASRHGVAAIPDGLETRR
jgi:hypothetical protein